MEGRIAAAAKPAIVKVAAICGSLRKNSRNRGILRSAIQLSKNSIEGMQIDYVDIEPLPFFNTDLEVNGTYPPVVEAFRRKILEADSILVASPQGYSVSAPLKNAIDWASRPPNVWADKLAAIVSAGDIFSYYNSLNHLHEIGAFLGLRCISFVGLYGWQPPTNLDSDGKSILQESVKTLSLEESFEKLRQEACRIVRPSWQPFTCTNFDSDGNLHLESVLKLRQLLLSFQAYIRRRKGRS